MNEGSPLQRRKDDYVYTKFNSKDIKFLKTGRDIQDKTNDLYNLATIPLSKY